MNALDIVVNDGGMARMVASYIDDGCRDPALVAGNVAHRLLRSRQCQVFPPPHGAPLAVRRAWDGLLAHVDGEFRRRQLVAGDAEKCTSCVVWSTVSTREGSADLDHYPWDQAVLHELGIATPGTIWLAGPDDTDATLVRDYLFSALAMAGEDTALAVDDSKVGRRLRREARELILDVPWNDARVTSTSATLAGGRDPGTLGPGDAGVVHVLGRHGRGLVWARRHYDDLHRLACGEPPKRGVDLQGNVIGSGRSPMVVYLPACNLLALRGPSPTVTCEGLVRANGSSTLHPPMVIEQLGVDTSGILPERS